MLGDKIVCFGVAGVVTLPLLPADGPVGTLEAAVFIPSGALLGAAGAAGAAPHAPMLLL